MLNHNYIAHLEPITRGNLVATARRARLVFQQVYPAHPPTEYQLHPSHPSPPTQIDDLPVRLHPETRPGYIRLVAPEDNSSLPASPLALRPSGPGVLGTGVLGTGSEEPAHA